MATAPPRPSRAAVREAIRAALTSAEFAASSDRAVAKHIGCTHKTVGRVRRELLERGELAETVERRGLDGKSYTSPTSPRRPDGEVSRECHTRAGAPLASKSVGSNESNRLRRKVRRLTDEVHTQRAMRLALEARALELTNQEASLEELRAELGEARRQRRFWADKASEVSEALELEQHLHRGTYAELRRERRRAESAEKYAEMWRMLANGYRDERDGGASSTSNTSSAELKAAYRTLSAELHPDLHPDEHERFTRAFQALRTLAEFAGL